MQSDAQPGVWSGVAQTVELKHQVGQSGTQGTQPRELIRGMIGGAVQRKMGKQDIAARAADWPGVPMYVTEMQPPAPESEFESGSEEGLMAAGNVELMLQVHSDPLVQWMQWMHARMWLHAMRLRPRASRGTNNHEKSSRWHEPRNQGHPRLR